MVKKHSLENESSGVSWTEIKSKLIFSLTVSNTKSTQNHMQVMAFQRCGFQTIHNYNSKINPHNVVLLYYIQVIKFRSTLYIT